MNLVIVKIDRLPEGFEALLEESRGEGFNFLVRLKHELHTKENTYSKLGESLYSCTLSGNLIAIGGINSQSNSQARIRRFYVSPKQRMAGVGSRLLKSIESNAFTQFDELVLYTDTKVAALFYERHGYIPVADENFSHRKLKCT